MHHCALNQNVRNIGRRARLLCSKIFNATQRAHGLSPVEVCLEIWHVLYFIIAFIKYPKEKKNCMPYCTLISDLIDLLKYSKRVTFSSYSLFISHVSCIVPLYVCLSETLTEQE